MRRIVYIGTKGCNACRHYKETVIEPLSEAYPGNVEIHVGFDPKIAEVDRRGKITRVPLVVVENGGAEEFRCDIGLTYGELEQIILCERDALTLDEAIS